MELHLIDACATLLGPQARKGGQGLLYQLDISVIRQAYRQLAVASHPDAAARAGAKPGSADGKRFIEASRAYELLMGYLLKRRGRCPRSPRGRKPGPGRRGTAVGKETSRTGEKAPRTGEEASRAGEKAPGTGEEAHRRTDSIRGGLRAERGRNGPRSALLPRPSPSKASAAGGVPLLFGACLLAEPIASIVWQRTAKPKFGELAKELHAISGRDQVNILRAKRRHEQTGETARRLRLLSADQVARILRLQRAGTSPSEGTSSKRSGCPAPSWRASSGSSFATTHATNASRSAPTSSTGSLPQASCTHRGGAHIGHLTDSRVVSQPTG